MMRSRPKLLLVVLLLASVVALSGQGEADPEPAYRLQIAVFPLGAHDWSGVYYAPDGDPARGVEELFFNPHERSDFLDYRGEGPPAFYREGRGPDGATIYRPVARFAPEAQQGRFLLLFEPDTGDDGPEFRVFGMTDSASSFPRDSLVFFNTTGVTLHGVLGEERIALDPGQSGPLDVTSFFRNPAPIGLAVLDGDRAHRVLDNKMSFSPDRRTLVILRPPAREGSLRIRSIRLTEFLGGDEDGVAEL